MKSVLHDLNLPVHSERQGGVLSPVLFTVYFDSILNELNKLDILVLGAIEMEFLLEQCVILMI